MSKLNTPLASLFFMLVVHGASIAQTRAIRGIVYNGITSKPLPGITVQVIGTTETSITSSTGEYKLQIPDSIKNISFADFAGLEIMEVILRSEEEINIYVSDVNISELSMDQLMKIKVTTANKFEQTITDIPASVVVVSNSEIKKYGYQTVPEILENVLGIFKHEDSRAESFGVRGFYSNVYNRTFVLMVNGMEQKAPGSDWNLFTFTNMQVEAIDRIEIVRGPLAVAYGNNAFFGAINIITNKSEKSVITAGYGADNTYRSKITSTLSGENANFSVSAGYLQTDGRNIPFEGILDSVQRYDGTWVKDSRTKGFFKRNSYYMNVSGSYKNLYANLSYDETNRNLIQTFAPILDTTKNKRVEKVTRLNEGYKKQITSKTLLDVRLEAIRYLENNFYERALVAPKIPYSLVQDESTQLTAGAVVLTKPIGWLSLILGAKYSSIPTLESHVDVPPFVYNQLHKLTSSINSHALYTQADVRLLQKLHLVAGLRYDKQEKYTQTSVVFNAAGAISRTPSSYNIDNPYFIPQVALIYQPSKKQTFKLSYNEAISRPSYYENQSITVNPTVYPQKIAALEVNYQSALSKNVAINASIFYNRLSHLIIRQRIVDPVTSEPKSVYNNSGEFKTLGGELQVIAKPIDKITFDVSATYQNTQDETYNIKAAYSPNFIGYLKTVYSITPIFHVSLIGNYVGKMETFWNNAPINPSDPNSAPVGRIADPALDYFKLGATITIDKIYWDNLSLGAHFTNILNQRVRYAPTSANYSFLPRGVIGDPFGFSLRMSLKF